MKLRLRGNSLRLRLRQPEVAALVAGSAVEDSTEFGPDASARFVCRIAVGPADDVSTNFADGVLSVLVPPAIAGDWGNNCEEVGIYAETSWGLRIAIEKDFRCLETRLDEDEAGSFERPPGYVPDARAMDASC